LHICGFTFRTADKGTALPVLAVRLFLGQGQPDVGHRLSHVVRQLQLPQDLLGLFVLQNLLMKPVKFFQCFSKP
jgi:hypothetical protein